MKLNFELCKICVKRKFFKNFHDGFNFKCAACGYFVFDVKEYKIKNMNIFNSFGFGELSENEFNQIKQMNIIDHQTKGYYDFNNCPYKLEHLVES